MNLTEFLPEFFNQVRPDAPGFLVEIDEWKPGQHTVKNTLFQNNDHLVELFYQRSDTRGCYYTPSAYRIDKDGSVRRTKDYVESLKSFYLDLDISILKGDECYPNFIAGFLGIDSIKEYCKLPYPSYVLDTGGGYHCYWCMDTTIPGNEWWECANQFKQILKHHGIRQDVKVTSDRTRILRIPFSINAKHNRLLHTVVPIKPTWNGLLNHAHLRDCDED
jgi:hypothetical protein